MNRLSSLILILFTCFTLKASAFTQVNGNTLYSSSTNNVGIGLNSPNALLHINGSILIKDGTEGAGKFLTSDASGKADWQSIVITSEWTDGGTFLYPNDNADIKDLGIGANSTIAADILLRSNGKAIFNEPSNNDVDFRVEGGTDQYLLFADGSEDEVAIGTSTTNERLTLEGVLSLRETTAPTNTSNYGKIYVKSSDSKLYYLDEGGSEFDLTLQRAHWLDVGSYVHPISAASKSVVIGSNTIANGDTVFYSDGSVVINELGNASRTTMTGTAISDLLVFDGDNDKIGIRTSSPEEKFHLDGRFALKNQTSDPSATAGYGKLYVKDDKLYFIDSSSNISQLAPAIGPAGSSQEYQFNDNGSFGTSSELWDNGSYVTATRFRVAKGSISKPSYRWTVDQGMGFSLQGTIGSSTATFNCSMNGELAFAIKINSGYMGIKDISPSYQLDVNGYAAKPGGGNWTVSSDINLKDIQGDYDSGLKEIMALNPIKYRYKANNPRDLPSDKEHVGFIAQEVLPYFPEAVSLHEDGYYDLDIHAINIATVNALKKLNDRLNKENNRIDNQFESIQGKLNEIKEALK